MKRLISMILLLCTLSGAEASEVEQKQEVKREQTEWSDIWIPFADKNDKPTVLLVGDSITRRYHNFVSKKLSPNAYCSRFATSASVADPAFHKQLESVVTQYKFTLIHFNNGLHGIGYSEKEYQNGYEKALKLIRKHSPSTKIIVVLSTPLKESSKKNKLNPRIDERNRIVSELAKKYKLTINDLNSISKGHPEYYIDPTHFNGTGVKLQGSQVAEQVAKALSKKHGIFIPSK